MKKLLLLLCVTGLLFGSEHAGMSKQEYYNKVIAPAKGRKPLTVEKTMGFSDRKRSVLDVGNMVLRLSNAATLGYDRWGLNHEFPAGSMQKDGCCTYYWTMSPIVGALVNGQPTVAVGVRGSTRDSEEEFEPLPGYDAGYVDTEANIGIAFSDKPESWPAFWPRELDPTGTYVDAATGMSFPGIEPELVDGFPDAPCGLGIQADREAYFVVTDNDPDEGNTFESNGVGPLNVRFDIWVLNYASSFGNDGLVFIQLMTNVGPDTLKDMYMGVAGDPDTPEQGGSEWTDDFSMFIEADDPHIAEKLSDTTDAHLLENFALVWDADDRSEGFKTSGIGWIGLKFLECTKIDLNGNQTSYDVSSVYTYEYSEDAQNDAQAYNEQLKSGIQTPHNITPNAADMQQKPYSYGPDITWVIASGPMDLAPGERVIFTFADFMGVDEADLLRNAKVFQSLYNNNCSTPKPPLPAPNVYAVADDGQVTLFWDADSTETSLDPVTGNNAFEGYRVYRSTDRGKSWGRVITDVNGNPTDIYQPLAIFDQSNGIAGAHNMIDPLVYYDLGTDAGLKYSFVDRSVINGYEYWYSVCAYDHVDDWTGAPVDPMENAKAKNAFFDGDNTVAVIPQAKPVGYSQNDAIVTHVSGQTDAILTAQYTDPAIYDFIGDEFLTDDDFISKGHDYEITFTNEADTLYYWTMVDIDDGDTVVAQESDLTPGGALHVVDGILPVFTNANWIINGEDTTMIIADADTTTSILFGGVGIGGYDNTWHGFYSELYENYPSVNLEPSGKPSNVNLQKDLEIRFTSTGSVASYFNDASLVEALPLDTIFVPFELWEVEDTPRRINIAVYQSGGNKPSTLYEPVDSSNSYKFVAPAQYIPVYSDYDSNVLHSFADHADIMGWAMKINKDVTEFEYDNVIRINFTNPLIGGIDRFLIETSPPDYTIQDGDMDEILVVPNPYVAASVYETNIEVKEIQFTRLPDECVIRIFNIAGELVKIINHNPDSDGYRGPSIEAWNLRTYNDQEISFGVYIFHVTADGEEAIGKFAVIK